MDSSYFDDPDSDYYEDEWYEDDDYEPDEYSYSCELGKATNGQLYVTEVYGWKYRHQDWGQTVGQWNVKHLSLSQLGDEYRELALKYGCDLKPGDEIPFPYDDD
jgi:hypothetical protein